jgi:hypothetical protein
MINALWSRDDPLRSLKNAVVPDLAAARHAIDGYEMARAGEGLRRLAGILDMAAADPLTGSSHIVRLDDLGHVAHALEDTLDFALDQARPATSALVTLIELAHRRFGEWIDALGRDGRADIDQDELMDLASRVRNGRRYIYPDPGGMCHRRYRPRCPGRGCGAAGIGDAGSERRGGDRGRRHVRRVV